MSIFDFLTLFGGLAMFLYGMRLMGDGLKESSSGTLKKAMEAVTNNPVKAFLLGLGVTAIIQSSTATIVITSGLVGAGLLTLHQSLGIIIGANVGTTVTGQIIRLLDLNASGGTSWLNIFKPSSLAPIALIIGMVLIMGGRFKSSRQVGNIAIGFGILFSGLLNMTSAVTVLTESGLVEKLFTGLGNNPVLGYLTGAGVAFVLQSSSATIGILQAFASSGMLTFKAVYPVIVGIYLGDSVTTAIVCSIGAGAEQRRVGIVNTLFNLSETVLVLTVMALLHKFGILGGLWDKIVNSGMIANTNTVFNLTCAIVLFPLLPLYERQSRRIVPDDKEAESKYKDKIEALNPMFFDTPALALRSCYDALLTQLRLSRQNIERAFSLLDTYSAEVYETVMEEEVNIDLLTDRISRYIVEFLPHVRNKTHAAILDEYYKVVGEVERIGDHAVNIADNANSLHSTQKKFSEAATAELRILEDLLREILDSVDLAFAKRDVEAAFRIEPLEEVADDMVGKLKRHHLDRMGKGECDIFVDANFENLMSDMMRIADVSTNIGEAVLIRVYPDIAQNEHTYFSALRSGKNQKFNKAFDEAYGRYLKRFQNADNRQASYTGSVQIADAAGSQVTDTDSSQTADAGGSQLSDNDSSQPENAENS